MPRPTKLAFFHTIVGGASILGVASLVSKVLGLYRERLLAGSFSKEVLDAYYAAFKIPDFFFNVFVLGALSSAFIPIFVDLWQQKSSDAWRFSRSVMTILLSVLLVIAVLIICFPSAVVDLLAPGFSESGRLLTIELTRIMVMAMVLFGISNILAGILNSFKRYVAYSIAPILYNLGIIIGVVWFVPLWGSIGLGYGVVLGAFCHLAVQIPAAWQAGFHFRPLWDVGAPGFRKMLRLMGPRTLALAAAQINLWVITNLASKLEEGSVWRFNVANNLQYFPISVFGVSLALASFPVFAEKYATNKTREFIEHFSQTFRHVLFLTIPVSMGILLLRAQFVRLFVGTGSVTWYDTILIANTLGVLAISLFAQSVLPLLVRSFYAQHDTKTPVKISLVSVVLNIVLSYLLAPRYGVIGLAVAFSASSILDMLWTLAALRVKLGYLDDNRIMWSTIKIVLASIGMAGLVQLAKYQIAPFVDMQTGVGILLQTVGAVIVGALGYFLLAMLFRSPEVDSLKRTLLNRVMR